MINVVSIESYHEFFVECILYIVGDDDGVADDFRLMWRDVDVIGRFMFFPLQFGV